MTDKELVEKWKKTGLLDGKPSTNNNMSLLMESQSKKLLDECVNKIDVFGGTGFIGSKFCEMYKDEAECHLRENNYPNHKNILYLISTTDNYNVLNDLHTDIDTNLHKLMYVLEKCKQGNYIFNYVSSWFVYGDCSLPANEYSTCNPRGFYSITKKCAEDLLISFCKTFNVKYRIFRLANVYGTGDKRKSKKKNALQYLIDEIKANRDINLYHGGNFIRDYIHVDDVCRAIKLCIDKSPINEIINIGSGYPYLFRNLMDYVANKVGYTGKMISVEPTEFHKIVQVKNFYMNVSKLKQGLGFNEEVGIHSGLNQLI